MAAYYDSETYRVSGDLVDYNGKWLGKYSGETMAPSPGKAKNNVLYHAKQALNLCAYGTVKWGKGVKVIKID